MTEVTPEAVVHALVTLGSELLEQVQDEYARGVDDRVTRLATDVALICQFLAGHIDAGQWGEGADG